MKIIQVEPTLAEMPDGNLFGMINFRLLGRYSRTNTELPQRSLRVRLNSSGRANILLGAESIGHCPLQAHPIGGFGGLNGGGGQYNFARSKGGPMGGGEPFDQSHTGQGGSAPVGEGTLLSIDCCNAGDFLAGAAGAPTNPRVFGSRGAITETEKRIVEVPRFLLMAPVIPRTNEFRQQNFLSHCR